MNDDLMLVDCDGVLLNWKDPYKRWMKQNQDLFTGFEHYEHRSIRMFNESWHFGNLPPYKDAVKVLKNHYSAHGVKLHVVTACGSTQATRQMREQNLHNVFGEEIISGITFTEFNACKKEALKPWHDTLMTWVDDSPRNYTAGVEVGLTSFLMHDHEYGCEGIDEEYIISNWSNLLVDT